MNLACHLLDCNSYCYGTARLDRKNFPSSLKKLKLDRGESRSTVVEDGKVNRIAWQDKKLVHFLDTISDPLGSTQVTRKKKMDHKF